MNMSISIRSRLLVVVTVFALCCGVAIANFGVPGFASTSMLVPFLSAASYTTIERDVDDKHADTGRVPTGAFAPGNIVVCRMGDGAAALNNAATAVFLDEFT